MLYVLKSFFSAVERQSEVDHLQLLPIKIYRKFTTLAHKPSNGKLTVCERSQNRFVVKTVISILYLIGTWYRLFVTYKNLHISQLMHALIFNIGVTGHVPILIETFRKRWEISHWFNSLGEFERLHSGTSISKAFLLY